MNENWTPAIRRREPTARDPSANRVLVRAQEGGRFGYGVVAMDFDAAAAVPPGHALGRLFDEVADVLDLPRRRARTELHRLRKAPGLDPRPPSGLAHRNGTEWRDDRAQANKAGRG